MIWEGRAVAIQKLCESSNTTRIEISSKKPTSNFRIVGTPELFLRRGVGTYRMIITNWLRDFKTATNLFKGDFYKPLKFRGRPFSK